jgi:hypothetical protein
MRLRGALVHRLLLTAPCDIFPVIFTILTVQRAFAERAVKEQPRPVEKRAPPPDDADDDAVVYADGEDPDDDKESWLDIVKDLHITPSDETVRSEKPASKSAAASASAGASAASASEGKKKSKAKGKDGKKGGKKKKK